MIASNKTYNEIKEGINSKTDYLELNPLDMSNWNSIGDCNKLCIVNQSTDLSTCKSDVNILRIDLSRLNSLLIYGKDVKIQFDVIVIYKESPNFESECDFATAFLKLNGELVIL